MNDKVLSFLKSNGPSTNVDISRGLGLQTYIIDALLTDMLGKQSIRKSFKRLGSTRVYYLPGQEERARIRVFNSLEPEQQDFLKQLQKRQVITDEQLSEEDMEEWQDFMVPLEEGATLAWHWFEVSPSAAKKLLGPSVKVSGGAGLHKKQPRAVPTPTAKKPAKGKGNVGKARVVGAQEKPQKPEIKSVEAGFADKVAFWLQSQGAQVLSESDSRDGYEIEVTMPTPLGQQAYLVVVKTPKKKKLGTGDVSDAYSKAVSRKAPVILVSSTGFAKSAEKFWSKGYENLLTLIDGKNL